ncbi:DUF2142 domain-containing protein [Rhabdothermincola sp.]|uniref:DUF2142 domain-containing protein n=1 Tax=Rhabdothermincola sp. TaxID=2820405 RepID=UPI002FE20210
MPPSAPTSTPHPARAGFGSRLDDRRVWWVSFLLLGALGAIWALSMPPLVGPDEPAHAGKAAAVVRGELTWVAREDILGTSDREVTRSEIWLRMPRAYAEPDYACIALPPLRPASCMSPVPRLTDEVEAINSAGAYPPVFYALVGWPSLLLPPSKAMYLMRLVNVALCSALLASALVAARRADASGTTIIGVAAAVTPMVVFLAAVINPNAVEIVAAMCTLAAGLELLRTEGRPSTRSIARFFVASSMLILARPLSMVMLLAIVALLALAASSRANLRTLAGDRRVQIGAVGLSVAAGFAAFWLAYATPQRALWGGPRPGITLPEALRESVSMFPWRVRQMIGVFGWIDAHDALPVWMIVWWLAVVGVLVVAALVVGSARQRLTVVASVIGVIALTLSEITQAERIGFVWQGRYSLPVAIAVPILAAWVIGTSGRIGWRQARGMGALAIGSLTVIMLFSYVVVMRRYVIGAPSPYLDYLLEGDWEPKLPKHLLLALATLATTALGLWLGTLALARQHPPAGAGPGEEGIPAAGTSAVSSSASLTV